jgi:hypothetical protein
MTKQPIRHDHTAWVTHFVRDRNPAQDFPGEDEDAVAYYAGNELDQDATAFEVLKVIVRLGGIMPGHSFRGGRTTIYGGQPAICATEMPLYALATYARSRAKGGNVSAYGISFLKSEFFEAGGRPAIYGLSSDAVKYIQNDALSRIFDDAVLPLREQFRYVAHNPMKNGRYIDWSHEREWRWIPQNKEMDEIWAEGYDGIGPKPALPLFKGKLEGRSFTRVCLIVWTAEEAKELRELLTALYLAGSNNYDTPFDKKLIERSHIIVLEDVVAAVEGGSDVNAQTIEGLAQAQLLEPIKLAPPPENVEQIVEDAFEAAANAATAAREAYLAERGDLHGGFGFAHAVTTDVTNPIVQYLLATDQASGPFDDEVWINYPGPRGSGEINLAEVMCQAAVEVLSERLGIAVWASIRDD